MEMWVIADDTSIESTVVHTWSEIFAQVSYRKRTSCVRMSPATIEENVSMIHMKISFHLDLGLKKIDLFMVTY